MRTPTRSLAAVALAATLLVGTAACSSDSKDAKDKVSSSSSTTSEGTTTTTSEGTTTTAPAPSTTGAPTSTTSGGTTTTTEDNGGDPTKEGTDSTTSTLDNLPSGWHYGYAAGLEEGKVEGQAVSVLLWDEVQFLTGAAAEKAAEAHHDAPLDSDYYIVNDNQKLRRLAVVPEASVTTLGDGGSPDQKPSSIDEISKQQYLFKILIQNVRGVTTITAVEGVYLP